MYFCILLKSWLDTIWPKIFWIWISVSSSSQDCIPCKEFLCICVSVFCSSPDWMPYPEGFFVFVFLYFDQVWYGYHMHKDSLYLYFCNLLKSKLDTIYHLFVFLYLAQVLIGEYHNTTYILHRDPLYLFFFRCASIS